MAPLVEAFPAHELESRINTLNTGKRRKPPVKLEECALKEMSQYFCELVGPREDPGGKVVCQEFVRSFRKCADGLTVETTAWEGLKRGR